MGDYLDGQAALNKLINAGIYTQDDAPSIGAVDDAIAQIEIAFEAWLNCSLAVRQYTDVIRAGDNGLALTPHYPIVRLIDAVPTDAGALNTFLGALPPNLVRWSGDLRTIDLVYPYARLRVTYEAGYNPIPREATQAVYNALRSLINDEQGNIGAIDVSSLNSPDLYVSSLTLPGGLSEEYARDNAGGGSGQPSTRADQLFTAAVRYRRSIVTTVGGW